MDLTPKQWQAWQILEDGTHTEILYGGAAGGGKSHLGASWLIANCLRYPGSRWLMGRSVLKTLKETTLNTFFDVASKGGLVAGDHYTYNSQAGVINIQGSEILLKDLFAYPSDPNFDGLGSLEITGAFIDECNQIGEKARDIVSSRIRYKLDQFGIIPKLLMTCNPARNWVYSQFYEPHIRGTLSSHRAFVQSKVVDNPHISPHYVDNLKRMSEQDRRRLLDGDWDYEHIPDALMRPDAIMDLWHNSHVEAGKAALTCDVARYGGDRTAIGLWMGMRLVQVVVMEGASTVEVAQKIKDMQAANAVPRSRIVVDDDGVGGGVVDQLPGCQPFLNNGRPIKQKGKDQNYANLKAQCSYELAEAVNEGRIWIVDDKLRDQMARELSFVRSYKLDTDSKLRVMPKEKVVELLGRSPDLADMLMMRMVLELKPSGAIFERSIDRAAKRTRDIYREQAKERFTERFSK